LEASVPKTPVISIVDDDETVRDGTLDLLKSMGFCAVAYSSAAEFLNSNTLHSTSCLIADVQMPGMTGLELHSRLVGSGNIIPTILITAYPDVHDRSRLLQGGGVICHLTKPFSYDDLFAGICSALGSHKAGAKE
jgi:FixJ family two-component response regulator